MPLNKSKTAKRARLAVTLSLFGLLLTTVPLGGHSRVSPSSKKPQPSATGKGESPTPSTHLPTSQLAISSRQRLPSLTSSVVIASPSISSISPSTPTASGSNQNITISGSSFQSGLTVFISFPGGGGTTLSGSQIQSVTSTSFVMVATLSTTGTWSIRVNNPDGGQSNTFFFTVQSASQPPSPDNS